MKTDTEIYHWYKSFEVWSCVSDYVSECPVNFTPRRSCLINLTSIDRRIDDTGYGILIVVKI